VAEKIIKIKRRSYATENLGRMSRSVDHPFQG
jgi:hypothetical protein